MESARVAFAPAKINLGLKILGRYANGYHHLETVFVPVSLCDRLTIRAASGDAVDHRWPATASADHRRQLAAGAVKNPLLLKTLAFARNHLKENFSSSLPALQITVEKRIPSPAGLGGASADAAALLHAIVTEARHSGAAAVSSGEFLAETEKLGADIPFFLEHGLHGRAARLSGVGHELRAVEIPPLAGWICVPDFGFPTAQMFAEVRKWNLPELKAQAAPSLQSNLTLRLNEIPYSDEPLSGVRVVQNDFDTAAKTVFPSESHLLSQAKLTLAKTVRQFFPGAWVVGMTGSGAGLFTATDMGIPMQRLVSLTGVLKARLGRGWQVLPYKNIGP